MSKLKIEYLPTDSLVPYINNPRVNKKAVDAVAGSIAEFGFKNPIVVDKNNVIIAGHTRLLAAQKLGLEQVPVIRAEDLTEKQVKAFRIADNKTAEFSEWDDELLAMEFEGLEDMFTGFTNEEIDELFSLFDNEFNEIIEEELPEPTPEPKSKLGDLWSLGPHRLLCGDSTKKEDVERLLDEKRADMIFMDPPYALFGNSTGVAGVVDDKMTRPFFLSVFRNARAATKLFGHIYTCCDWHSAFSLQAMAREAGLTEKNLCIWDKGDGGVGAMYQQCYEMIWFHANSPLATKTLGKTSAGERTIQGKPNIWRYPRVTGERLHNAQKPVEMIAFAISNSCDKDEIVLDLFGGSGSTLIACEQLNRACYTMELDPVYVDVIIARWEQFTGQEAVLLS